MAKTPSPYKYHDGWRAQVTLRNGTRPFKDFRLHCEAKQWIVDQLSLSNTAHEAVLGGPTSATLAQALDHYARHFSIAKGGVAAELNRINRYLGAVNMPLLKAVINDKGVPEILQYIPSEAPSGWQAYAERRRAQRAKTYALFKELAPKRCSNISAAHIRALFNQMNQDGLSTSTIQKEIAMLKAMFNTAILEWEWKAFENPCRAIKLGKSDKRFVHMSKEQREALNVALAECDNPYFWPLAIVAKETTLRRATLLKMQWSHIDLENRTMLLPTKTGQMKYSISKPVQMVLAHLARDPSGYVFPMTKNAVTLCWGRVRRRAGLPHLQFRDLRHLGATDWVRRGLSTHSLKHTLGHSTIATAQYYVDLVGEDQIDALDKASAQGGDIQLPPSSPESAQTQRNEKRAQRLNRPKLAAPSQGESDNESDNEADSEAVREAAPIAASAPGRPVTSAPGVDAGRACSTCATPTAPSAADATDIFLLAHGQNRQHGQDCVDETLSQTPVATNVLQFRPRKAA